MTLPHVSSARSSIVTSSPTVSPVASPGQRTLYDDVSKLHNSASVCTVSIASAVNGVAVMVGVYTDS
jgi:hypothetical protein